ncbi:uncharacterized protein LOC144039553 isoform X2 [Vanacampus margaritifer]
MEKRCSGNTKKRSQGYIYKKQLAQSRPHCHGMTPGGGYQQPPGNGPIFCQYSNHDLAAQNAALREQLLSQHHRHDHERQRLLRALKKPGQSKSDDIIAAVNEEWQHCWATREQETAAQFQTHQEGMQRYMDDMAAYFHFQLENMHVHNVDTVCFFQSEMAYLGRAISEKDELARKLKKENAVLVAQNKEMYSELCTLKADAAEPPNSREDGLTNEVLLGQVEKLEDAFESLAVHKEELEGLRADW